MKVHLKASFVAAAILAGTTGFASAQRGGGGGAEIDARAGARVGSTTTNTRGGASMGTTQNQRGGANRKGFCPPGQAKKKGQGSAFQC